MNDPSMEMPMGGDSMQDPMMGNGMPNDPMMGDPNMGMPMGGSQNQFDTNFDAGVEADENSDPKKYIQQLTGKLSQTLRNYNEGQPQADADLNKYVAGMIVKQAIEGLSPDDVQEILNKVKSDDDMEQQGSEQPMGGQEPTDMPMDGQQPQFDGMESRQRSKSAKTVNETMTLDDGDENDSLDKYNNTNKKSGYRTRPFRL